jgi:protein-disulfide isomerase
VLEKYPATVKLVFKNFPLDMHPLARKAASAALAAHRQAKFWEYHHRLFEGMSSLSDQKFLDIAKELNLDIERFRKDMNDQSVQGVIQRDVQNGSAAGVTGTPTIFVNGKRLTNRSLQGFQQMIDEEVKK